MKRGLLVSIICVFITALGFSQTTFKFGILGGVSMYNVDAQSIIIANQDGRDIAELAYDDAGYGMHFGIFVLAKASFLYIKPQIQFNSQTVDYSYDELRSGDVKILSETYQNIDIPVQLGLNIGPLRLGVGPVGHIHLDGKSDFFAFNKVDYQQKFKEMTFGYILGAGLDIWNFHIDAGYEGNFSQLGDHIVLFNRKVNFDSYPSRFVLTLGVSF